MFSMQHWYHVDKIHWISYIDILIPKHSISQEICTQLTPCALLLSKLRIVTTSYCFYIAFVKQLYRRFHFLCTILFRQAPESNVEGFISWINRNDTIYWSRGVKYAHTAVVNQSCHISYCNVYNHILQQKIHKTVLKHNANTLRSPFQTFSIASFNENLWILNKMSLKYALYALLENMAAFVQIMAWCGTGDKPLFEEMMV